MIRNSVVKNLFFFINRTYTFVWLIHSVGGGREVGESAKHVILSSAGTAAGKARVNMRVRKLLQLQNP